MEESRDRKVGLFRYGLIRPLLDEELKPAERGRLVVELAAVEHPGPDGHRVRLSRTTIYRWYKSYRDGGFDALVFGDDKADEHLAQAPSTEAP